MRAFLFASVAVLQVVVTGVAGACSLPQPAGKVILTVTGHIGACSDQREVRLDRAMIHSLPLTEVRTKNPWEHGRATYQGVLLRDLLHYVKAHGKMMELSALNDFHTEISIADTKKYNILLAFRRNGVELTVRDKGPFFVVFPFSDVRKLETEARFAQSIWQVNHIEVK